MALPKLFQRIIWHNNTTPAIQEDNLNAMSKGLSDVDDRVIGLAGTIMEDVPQIQEDMEELEADMAVIDTKIASATAEANRATTAANNAAISVISAANKALISEGWAKGTQNGSPVGSDSPYYHNNSEYFKEEARNFTPQGYQDLVDDVEHLEESITGEVVDSEPYVLRQGLGNLADMALVGGSVAWNQLCNGSSVTVPNGHKYYMRKSGTTSIGASTGSAITGLTSGTDNVIDLTALFGSSTIADYIYSLEQATAGAGVAWFRKYFPNAYYGYQSGKIESVNVASRKVVGKNLLPYPYVNTSKTENGVTFTDNGNGVIQLSGSATARTTFIFQGFSSNFRPAKGTYTINKGVATDDITIIVDGYTDSNVWKKTLAKSSNPDDVTFEVNYDEYDRITLYIELRTGISYNNYVLKPMLRLATVEDATYEPYQSSIYAFDSSKQFRGIFYLDANNKLCADGDIYTADGIVTRKYGIVDLGTLNWAVYSGVFYTAALTTAKQASGITCICSKYKAISNVTGTEGFSEDKTCAFLNNTSSYRFYVKDSAYNDAATFKTAMSGVYLVYELATPTTESANAYQNPQRAFIDGTEEFVDYGVQSATRDVSIPVGNNTTYQLNETLPPTEDYVDGALKFKAAISALGDDESGRTTASRTYTAGEFFYKDGKMYKVLTSIAQGATFTINTNCQQTTLFAELKALAQ